MSLSTVRLRIETAPAFEPFLSPARFKGTYGGRGSGKSWFWAGEAIKALVNGRNVLCIREVQNSIADSVKRLIEARVDEFNLSGFFDITDKEIRCPRAGSVAIFRGMQNHTAATIKSLEGFDVAWWEEAQTASQMSLDLLVPTIRKPGSELWFSWNPQQENDPIDQFLRVSPPDEAVVRQINWSDNPWFPDELRRDMERDRERQPDKYLHVWEGRYQTLSEARVFRNWRIGEEKPPINAVWHYGADFGFAQDATAGVRCCLIGDTKLYVDAEVYEVGVPTDALPAFFARLPEARQWQMTADNARPETIDYCKRNGLPKMRPTRKGKGSVEDGISFLQGLDIVVHPRCANLVRELGSYSYRIDKRTGAILPMVEDGNDHLIDALRYACERLHRKGRLIQAQQSEDTRRSGDYGFMQHEEDAESWKVV
jgi:phage terminase large subunit